MEEITSDIKIKKTYTEKELKEELEQKENLIHGWEE